MVWGWDYWGYYEDKYRGHPSTVDSMIALDADTLLTGCGDGLIRIINIHPNKILGVVGEHCDDMPVDSLSISKDKLHLISTGDTTVKFWNLSMLFETPSGESSEEEEGEVEENEEGAVENEEGGEESSQSGDGEDSDDSESDDSDSEDSEEDSEEEPPKPKNFANSQVNAKLKAQSMRGKRKHQEMSDSDSDSDDSDSENKKKKKKSLQGRFWADL